ncbi:MAG TPA: flavodoxin family protein [Methanoregulaceae archaeon]|nr:flavodoxin family protein [Methanoregulaceae archaeon]HPD75051.1 flavodoxin family protein [Methanoregulaceae archaeon]HRY75660.1 flavodoxin family protein [Methanoregulaceae archaeon]
MGKKVIGLLGSPLPEGNTARLLERALQGARDAGCETETIHVATLSFEACMEMMFCRDHDTCIMDDDMQPIYGKLKDLDGLIIATPVMTMGIPGKLKSFIDRCQIFFMAKYVRRQPFITQEQKKRRRALLLCISGMNVPGVFDGVKKTVQAFLDIIDCPLMDELLVPGMDTLQDITASPGIPDEAYAKGLALGKQVCAP